MPGVSRVGVDSAGAEIVGNLVPSVLVNGAPVVVRGAAVVPHGTHVGVVMQGASGTVLAGGIPVCRAGDSASCGHAATGSTNVLAG